MLIPIGSTEHDGVIGWGSVTLMAIMIIVHIFVSKADKSIENIVKQAAQEEMAFQEDSVAEDYAQRGLDPFTHKFDSLYNETGLTAQEVKRKMLDPELYYDMEKIEEVKFEARKSSPYLTYGLVQGNLKWWQFFTHQFLHGDWVHLIGNLIFFYVAAIMLERYWGLPIFIATYVAMGALTGALYLLFNIITGVANPFIPMVGASGAIAGAMGAFMIVFRKSKIVVAWFTGFRAGIFEMGSWWYFGLWLGEQIFYATMHHGQKGGGVAFMAHILGFGIGVGTAFILPGMDGFGNRVRGFGRSNAKYKRHRGEEHVVLDENMSLEDRKKAQQNGDIMGTLAPVRIASVMDPAWESLDRENPTLAASAFEHAVDNLLQQEAHNSQRLKEELAKFYTIHEKLGIDPTHYYHWGRKLQFLNVYGDAIRCFEWGATKTTDIQIRCKSLLLAAGLRGDLQDNFAIAGKQVQYVIQKGPEGPLKQEAQQLLEKLQHQYQSFKATLPPEPESTFEPEAPQPGMIV